MVSLKLLLGVLFMKKVILFIGVMAIMLFSGCEDKVNPVIARDDSAQVVANGSVTIDVLANDYGKEGFEKSIIIVTNGAHGDTEITANKTIIYTARDGYVGSDSFTYILGVDDRTDKGNVAINIVDPENIDNIAPHVSAGIDQSMELSKTITIVGQDWDEDGSIVSKEWSSVTEVLATAGTFDYTATSLGTHVLTYTVIDNEGASASDSMNVVVTEPINNHAPVAEDKDVEISSCDIGQSINIQLEASDSDEDDLFYSIVDNPTYGTVQLTDEITGMATFTIEDSMANGACLDGMSNSFTFKVNDGNLDSNSATVRLLVAY